MVDKELIFLAKNEKYAFIKWEDSQGNIGNKLVYSNGDDLRYGDPAEIIPVAGGEGFKQFMESALSESGYYREHYSFTFGYKPADFDSKEIKDTEVKTHYAGVDNTISKKEFYELCLLLCNAKMQASHKNSIEEEELKFVKSQLEQKIKAI
jgi:hypothetical protein